MRTKNMEHNDSEIRLAKPRDLKYFQNIHKTLYVKLGLQTFSDIYNVRVVNS